MDKRRRWFGVGVWGSVMGLAVLVIGLAGGVILGQRQQRLWGKAATYNCTGTWTCTCTVAGSYCATHGQSGLSYTYDCSGYSSSYSSTCTGGGAGQGNYCQTANGWTRSGGCSWNSGSPSPTSVAPSPGAPVPGETLGQVAARYNVDSRILDAIWYVETRRSGSGSWCAACAEGSAACGPMQIGKVAFRSVTTWEEQQVFNRCSLPDAWEIAARVLLWKKYGDLWKTSGGNISYPNDLASVGRYYGTDGCYPDNASQCRWGTGFSYCDAVNRVVANPTNPSLPAFSCANKSYCDAAGFSTGCVAGVNALNYPKNSPPVCTLSGPISVGYPSLYSGTYVASCSDADNNLTKIGLHWSKAAGETWDTGVTCTFSARGTASCSRAVNFPGPGNYYVTVNGYDSAGVGGWCSGNPWCEWEPMGVSPQHDCTAMGFANCGLNDLLMVTVK